MLANTAAVTSLLSFYNHSTWLKVAGGAYLGYLWLSVISHGRSSMHWFSDTVAGTLIGLRHRHDRRRRFPQTMGRPGDRTSGFSFSAAPALVSISFSIPL